MKKVAKDSTPEQKNDDAVIVESGSPDLLAYTQELDQRGKVADAINEALGSVPGISVSVALDALFDVIAWVITSSDIQQTDEDVAKQVAEALVNRIAFARKHNGE